PARDSSSDPPISSPLALRPDPLRELWPPPKRPAPRSAPPSATDRSKTFQCLFPRTTAAWTGSPPPSASPPRILVCLHTFQTPLARFLRSDGTPGNVLEE